MGNLRNKYTDEEWYELEVSIEKDRRNGKPDDLFLSIPIYNEDLDKLRKIRNYLSEFYSDYNLLNLDKWINWKTNENN